MASILYLHIFTFLDSNLPFIITVLDFRLPFIFIFLDLRLPFMVSFIDLHLAFPSHGAIYGPNMESSYVAPVYT